MFERFKNLLVQELSVNENLITMDAELASDLAEYVYKLALLSQKKFTAEEMQAFMSTSYKLLMNI